jgi:hypothetical protein
MTGKIKMIHRNSERKEDVPKEPTTNTAFRLGASARQNRHLINSDTLLTEMLVIYIFRLLTRGR